MKMNAEFIDKIYILGLALISRPPANPVFLPPGNAGNVIGFSIWAKLSYNFYYFLYTVRFYINNPFRYHNHIFLTTRSFNSFYVTFVYIQYKGDKVERKTLSTSDFESAEVDMGYKCEGNH